MLYPRMLALFRLWFLPLAAFADECEDPNATSWIQMKLHYELTEKSDEGYYWAKRGGDRFTSSSVNWSVPDISQTPSWIWPNLDHEQARHSPLIDDHLDIYVTTTTKVRKFDQLGNLLWTWHQGEKMVTAPTLYRGKIYCLAGCGSDKMHIYAIHMENGTVDWNVTMSGRCGLEANSLLAVRSTLVMPFADPSDPVLRAGGANGLRAVSTGNGTHLWDFQTDDIFWNFAPSAIDDSSLIFSASCGAVYRLSLSTGQVIWKVSSPHPDPWPFMCGTGGGAIGPNGIFYAESNVNKSAKAGRVAAYDASNGQKLWQKNMDEGYEGIHYPAVGRLGPNGKLAVVVGVGQNTGLPPLLKGEATQKYLTDPEFRAEMQVPHFNNRVMALDAATGETLWQYDEPVWDHFGAAGDEERVFFEPGAISSIDGMICLPDAQGIPVINQLDGTVFFSSSHSGNLTAIRDSNNDGIIDASEVKNFAPGIAFLNSPSMAPGLLVAAPCWGPVYTFKQTAATADVSSA